MQNPTVNWGKWLKVKSYLKHTAGDGTNDCLSLLVLTLGRLNLLSDRNMWLLICKGCWDSKTTVCPFERTLDFTQILKFTKGGAGNLTGQLNRFLYFSPVLKIKALPNKQVTENKSTDSVKKENKAFPRYFKKQPWLPFLNNASVFETAFNFSSRYIHGCTSPNGSPLLRNGAGTGGLGLLQKSISVLWSEPHLTGGNTDHTS